MLIRMSLHDRLEEIPASGIRRLFELSSKYADVISLGIGEPDFDTPAHIKEYAKEALDRGITHYTPNNGLKELRDAISEKLKKENSIFADPDKEIIVTTGGNQAFLLIWASFLKEGDEVLIPSPHFVTYSATVRLAGGVPVEVPLKMENGFVLTVDDLQRHLTERTRAIVLNSPNNPTGAVLTEKDVRATVEFAEDHGLAVVSDEVYESLVYDGIRHVSPASVASEPGRFITVGSLSKTYAMTGWRIGYAAGPEDLIARMVKFQMYLSACPTSFAQYAAARALSDPRSQAAVSQMRSEYMRRRDYIYRRLKQIPGFSVVKPGGAFYIFPFVGDDLKISEKLLVEARVAAVPGSTFGVAGRGHLRLAYTVPVERLGEAMDRIEKALDR
ncbi:MAG: Aspartate aminotransferase [Candidatus Methanosuratincola subterraneus]|uniref:Aminotransferase n=1 Tax=Methanosuratincola subterraneus TaxID=2593994 RepID=A0A444L945_METS7|nr:MAG: Aspartate aminotransferase [Candidatus Methanosuratincola subterraneus]